MIAHSVNSFVKTPVKPQRPGESRAALIKYGSFPDSWLYVNQSMAGPDPVQADVIDESRIPKTTA